MNIHHLELFYYVARHGGIMEGVRHIPYGIQQPAVSAQIAQLEEALGTTLFHRRPFALTPAGDKLYQFIKPFFDNLDAVELDLRGGAAPHFRFGASGTVLRNYFPAMIQGVQKQFPQLRLSLREGHQPQLLEWLHKQDIDMALTVLDIKPPVGMHTKVLVELSLVLLVPQTTRYRTAADLWKCDRIEETLISLPAHEGIARHFQQGLRRLEVEWFPGIEVDTLDLIEACVNNGYGCGIAVARPRYAPAPNVRVLPLPEFPRVSFGALWRGKPTPVMQAFLNQAEQQTQLLKT